LIGEGGFGQVFKVRHIPSGKYYAGKTISWASLEDQSASLAEIEAMKKLDHPNLIKLFEYYEMDDAKVMLIMEYLSGENLYERILENELFEEDYAKTMFEQIVQAISFSHEKSICHRDIKPENFVFVSKEGDSMHTLKLIDFGLSTAQVYGNMNQMVGSCFYMPPEVIMKNYDNSCDLWSAGIILFIMMCGYPPFAGETDEETIQQILAGEVIFDDEEESW